METSASQELTCKNRYSRETHKVIKWSKVITLGKELHGVFYLRAGLSHRTAPLRVNSRRPQSLSLKQEAANVRDATV